MPRAAVRRMMRIVSALFRSIPGRDAGVGRSSSIIEGFAPEDFERRRGRVKDGEYAESPEGDVVSEDGLSSGDGAASLLDMPKATALREES